MACLALIFVAFFRHVKKDMEIIPAVSKSLCLGIQEALCRCRCRANFLKREGLKRDMKHLMLLIFSLREVNI